MGLLQIKKGLFRISELRDIVFNHDLKDKICIQAKGKRK